MAGQPSLNWAWLLIVALVVVGGAEADPQPQPWPLQFHALLFQNFSGELGLIDLWYDWPNGRNLNLIQEQLGTLTYDVERTNGTSFFYDLQQKTCRTVHVPVGILRPNWLEDAEYLGAQQLGGFNCNLWQKLDFITYWEDVDTKRPVKWVFYTGRAVDVMTFEEGAVLEDSKWQAPEYCFDKAEHVVPSSVQGQPERWLQTAKRAAA